ncbi:hypothetical protein ATP_00327 [Candidatus Phytoplasma mali]|uniref:Uncharacterized protein n=1 Tax=Phytoplasma mali (strain AT) TaxID=482235 RepID=B3QZX7_PHYMT|nr:hypothetical protein [Candidatus Phytoplasma mali]CAP18514.1 hypothetical protein ATP_00327 [Candidatus Phytoplasma mali]
MRYQIKYNKNKKILISFIFIFFLYLIFKNQLLLKIYNDFNKFKKEIKNNEFIKYEKQELSKKKFILNIFIYKNKMLKLKIRKFKKKIQNLFKKNKKLNYILNLKDEIIKKLDKNFKFFQINANKFIELSKEQLKEISYLKKNIKEKEKIIDLYIRFNNL